VPASKLSHWAAARSPGAADGCGPTTPARSTSVRRRWLRRETNRVDRGGGELLAAAEQTSHLARITRRPQKYLDMFVHCHPIQP
jgi:hypothetical protein